MKREGRPHRAAIFALTLAGLIALATQSTAATHYVSQTSPDPTPPYSTPETAAHNIQDAINVAVDGDIVLVAPGNYGVTNQINMTNAVRLRSWVPTQATVSDDGTNKFVTIPATNNAQFFRLR